MLLKKEILLKGKTKISKNLYSVNLTNALVITSTNVY